MHIYIYTCIQRERERERGDRGSRRKYKQEAAREKIYVLSNPALDL